MSANIREMGIDIPGQVTRTYDKDSDTTSLVVTAGQALSLQGTIATVVQAFRLLGQLPPEPDGQVTVVKDATASAGKLTEGVTKS